MNRNSAHFMFLYNAIDNIISIDDTDYGTSKYLRPYIMEGYRSNITDILIEKLEFESNKRIRSDLLTILYYIQGATTGFIQSDIRDPRPENANKDEPMSIGQLNKLIELGLRENDPDVIEGYVSTIGCIVGVHKELRVGAKCKLNELCDYSIKYSHKNRNIISHCKILMDML
jgi:hypothetical protein